MFLHIIGQGHFTSNAVLVPRNLDLDTTHEALEIVRLIMMAAVLYNANQVEFCWANAHCIGEDGAFDANV